MKLKVHLIAGGKYYPAGAEIPEEEVPEFASKYSLEGLPKSAPRPERLKKFKKTAPTSRR